MRGDTQLVAKLESVLEVTRMIEDIARDLASNKAYTPSTMSKFVQLCNYMRYTFIICDVHRTMESHIDEKVCEQCEMILMGSRFYSAVVGHLMTYVCLPPH